MATIHPSHLSDEREVYGVKPEFQLMVLTPVDRPGAPPSQPNEIILRLNNTGGRMVAKALDRCTELLELLGRRDSLGHEFVPTLKEFINAQRVLPPSKFIGAIHYQLKNETEKQRFAKDGQPQIEIFTPAFQSDKILLNLNMSGAALFVPYLDRSLSLQSIVSQRAQNSQSEFINKLRKFVDFQLKTYFPPAKLIDEVREEMRDILAELEEDHQHEDDTPGTPSVDDAEWSQWGEEELEPPFPVK